ncbi:PREDICTED: regulator of G-protein signaling 7-binding protein A-like [Eufriesea mexicana]|uniref:regulator of G-protein signaling 7-binding protein A-like n=1 Tax=Eufriesea mexicana TaxID=516756 RepID=UPI00083C12D7|nr:PREDICTED: regulator of G-protein signaling 7-binding protein A-like [Eufriesea mexicana]
MTESPIPSVSNVQTHTRAPSQSQVQTQIQDDKNEKTDKAILLQIQEINSQVAQFRDLLISIGQPRDCPELREKIRRLRRNCVEACKNTSRFVLPQVRRTTDIGIPVDCPNSMLLFYVIQLFLRELCKSKNLIRIVPMDMTEYYETRTGPSNIGNVISQIVLCKQITPNFYEEELCSIQKDSEEIRGLINELQEFMPQSASDIEKYSALQNAGSRGNRSNGRRMHRWNQSHDRPNRPTRQSSYFRGALNLFCCAARANYV